MDRGFSWTIVGSRSFIVCMKDVYCLIRLLQDQKLPTSGMSCHYSHFDPYMWCCVLLMICRAGPGIKEGIAFIKLGSDFFAHP